MIIEYEKIFCKVTDEIWKNLTNYFSGIVQN